MDLTVLDKPIDELVELVSPASLKELGESLTAVDAQQ
jgi:hypothetical protein